MIDKNCNERDIRKLDRYNKILVQCRKPSVLTSISEGMPYTTQTIRKDCQLLSKEGYLKTERIQTGAFNQFTLTYTTLIKKYDDSKILPTNTVRSLAAASRAINEEPKEVSPSHIRVIAERMVYSTRPKSADTVASGATMSTSVW